MNVLEKVKSACKEKKTTIAELERDAGFAKGMVYKWERHSPSINNLAKVANILDKPIDYFVEG